MHNEVIKAQASLEEAAQKYLSPNEMVFFRPLLDFFFANPAPASASKTNHGCFEGGLIVHTDRVHRIARQLASGIIGAAREVNTSEHPFVQGSSDEFIKQIVCLGDASIFKVCLLHDFNKLRTVGGDPYYMPNILAKGNRSDAKPWVRHDMAEKPMTAVNHLLGASGTVLSPLLNTLISDEGVSVREGRISLAIAAGISPGVLGNLTPAEEFAIIFHDGAYAGRTGLTGKETMLQQVLHTADMIASAHFC